MCINRIDREQLAVFYHFVLRCRTCTQRLQVVDCMVTEKAEVELFKTSCLMLLLAWKLGVTNMESKIHGYMETWTVGTWGPGDLGTWGQGPAERCLGRSTEQLTGGAAHTAMCMYMVQCAMQ